MTLGIITATVGGKEQQPLCVTQTPPYRDKQDPMTGVRFQHGKKLTDPVTATLARSDGPPQILGEVYPGEKTTLQVPSENGVVIYTIDHCAVE